jgi:methionyl-tRNA synthetase
LVTFEEFGKVELRVARIVDCAAVVGASKLLKLTLDLGPIGNRTIASGISQWYAPEALVGKKIIVVANLDPKVIRGVQSQGMLLAAEDSSGAVKVVFVDDSVPEGSTVH